MPFTFQSSTEAYKSGVFNETIKKILLNYEKILNVVLPTLRRRSQENLQSHFFQLMKIRVKILQVPINEINTEEFTISFTYTKEKLICKVSFGWPL